MSVFLTIYTPTYRRPALLAANKASVAAQTCDDCEHVIRTDDVGVGIAGMYRQLQADAEMFNGCYVYILQDDDRLVDKRVVQDLKAFVDTNNRPPVIIMRSRKAHLTLPYMWQQEPRESCVDLGNYVVRRDVFQRFKAHFSDRYQADYDFIKAVWDGGESFAWFNRHISTSDQFGFGKPEKVRA